MLTSHPQDALTEILARLVTLTSKQEHARYPADGTAPINCVDAL